MQTYMYILILVFRSLSAILAEHCEKYLAIDKFNTYRIRVHRRKLWDVGCEELRCNFDVRKHLKVNGEKGEDGGGPK